MDPQAMVDGLRALADANRRSSEHWAGAAHGLSPTFAATSEMLSAAANALAATIRPWSKEPPEVGGLYWHWSGDEDDAPFPLHVAGKGMEGKCFVMRGQGGIENAINCDEYGGWWRELPDPETPDVTNIGGEWAGPILPPGG